MRKAARPPPSLESATLAKAGVSSDLVQRQREAREYHAFLRDKVEAARASMQAGEGRSNEALEARLASRRAAALRQVEGSGG